MVTQLVSHRADVVFIEQAVTVQAAAYATGDLVGGKLALDYPGSNVNSAKDRTGGLIQSVVITDLAKQNITKDVVFFDTDPSNTTFTENAALAINDTDLLNIIGVVQVSSWFSYSDNSSGQALNLAMPFVMPADATEIYAAIIERGAPTYASTSDLHLRVGLIPA